MRPPFSRTLAILFTLLAADACVAGADSVVTFNELFYNPAPADAAVPGQATGEWIELKNQNSVDVDISGWRLDGGVDYVFPQGTIIRGGKYLVVAENPAALVSARGTGGVLGPFSNSLSNGGETVTLKNINGREMDRIAWVDRQPWPVAADGSGASLSKIDEMRDSETPENWRASVEAGGTPGAYNFTELIYGLPVPQEGLPGAVMRYYRFEGDSRDSSGRNVHGTQQGTPTFSPQVPPLTGSGEALELNGTSQYVTVQDTVQSGAYTVSAWVKPNTIRAQSMVLRTDASGPVTSHSHEIRMNGQGNFEHLTSDGGMRVVTGTTAAVAGQWYHVAIVAWNSGLMKLYVNGTEEGAAQPVNTLWMTGTRWVIGSNSEGAANFDGLLDDVAIWHGAMDASQVGHLATGFKMPSDAAVTNLALGRRVINGSGAWPDVAWNSGTVPQDFSAANVTDGSAGDVAGSSYWLGRAGAAQEYFLLDLGRPVAISRILLRNTHNGGLNDAGTADFRLLGGNGLDPSGQLVNPTGILTGTLTARPVAAGEPANAPIPADSFAAAEGLVPATVRYLKFETLSSSAGGTVGLNEIEVFGSVPAGSAEARPPAFPLVINEIADPGTDSFWVELYNHGTSPLDVSGFVLATSRGNSWTVPESSLLAGGGFLVLDESSTGLHPVAGDRLFLYGREKVTVIDAAVVEAQRHLLRHPPVGGGVPGQFLAAAAPADITPGAPNHITLSEAVVINEIMYHHRPQFRPFVENKEEWIELYNKSADPVDLSGWRLDDGVKWTFVPGTILAAGGYLCVTNDAVAFAAAHPGVPVAGNFSGGLSNSGEPLVLRDALGNAVDEVFYRDKEPWPSYTDGLGSSMELKNPDADNSVPESWAASDESLRSEWHDYSFTAAASTPKYSPTITTSGTTAFHELRLGLLEEGEALVDDVSVREITTLPDRELIQNGSFDSGTTAAWRLLGNHDGSAIFNDAGNSVLRIRSTGPLFYLHNLLETTFKSGAAVVPVVNGRQYRISLRAKWLRGCPWVHAEIYYNKVVTTFLLDLPAGSGTPGARNSVYVPNAGPSFSGVRHSPVLPAAAQAATVSARVSDTDGVASVNLRYSVNGSSTFRSVPMVGDADGIYTGSLPGQSANAVTQFYLEATDAAALPAAVTWPAAGPDSRALIKVNDNASVNGKQNLRVITTSADANALASPVDTMSNHRRGCTIIHNDREVFYDGKIRLRGSMFSRGDLSTSGESLTFPADHLFRGTQRTVSVRRGGMEEIVVKHAINAAGGLPDNYNDIINLISFRPAIRGPARLEMERFSNSWLDGFYPDGSDGTMFKMEGIRIPTQTFANGPIRAGNPEGIKNLTTSGIGWAGNLDIADLGPDGEQYRHSFRWLNNFSRNENARFVEMSRVLSMPTTPAAQGDAFEAAIEPLMDVDEWMRCFAMMSLFGINDAYSQGNPHNLNFYMPPTLDGRISAIPWDWNFVFSLSPSAPLTGNGNIQKVISRPRFKRLFLGHLKDLTDTVFVSSYMSPWFAHYGTVAGANYTGYTSNLNTRRTTVLSQIKSQIPVVAFSITTNGGADFPAAGASTVLEGEGWVDVHEIRINGSPESLPVFWRDQNSWRITVPLGGGVNPLVLTAFDRRGVQTGTAGITVTNTSERVQAATINTAISKVHYNPAPGGQEFLEVMNISPVDFVDLSGCAFTAGIEYTFPNGTTLAPRARILVTAAQFSGGTGLSNAGETITLKAPGGIVIRSFTYDDEAPWPAGPDGFGPSLVLVAPLTGPDHSLASNWRASASPGGSPGMDDAVHLTLPPLEDNDGDGRVNLLEYALGEDDTFVARTGPEGTFTVSRVPNADDAGITCEVSTTMSIWEPAELTGSTDRSLTFRAPEKYAGEPTLFFRARVRLR